VISYILLIIISILPFFKIFSINFVDGHDFLLHFHRIYALENMIRHGIFLPRWLPDAVYGYGSPIFTFIWGVPYYLGVLLHMLGLSYEWVFRILLILPSILSGIGFYLWTRPKCGKWAAVIGAIVYIWTPYRFLDSFIRNALGELFFFAFFPFVLYFLDKAHSKKMIVLGVFVTALLIYSHQGLLLVGFPILIGYILLSLRENKKKKILYNQLFILTGGLLLTFFYWFPAVIYQNIISIGNINITSSKFPPLLSLIRSKWEGGSIYDGRRLIMSFQIGLANLGILLLAHILALYSFIKKRGKTTYLFFWLMAFWLSIFFMQPISKWFWNNIPFIANLQFPFRLLFIPMFVSSVLASLILSRISKYKRYLLGILFILGVIIGNRNHLGVLNKEIDLKEFISYSGTYDVGGETLPKYVSLKNIDKNLAEFTIISGKGIINSQQRQDYESTASVTVENDGQLLIKRIYFPGWQVTINGKKTENFEKTTGIILDLPEGKSEIKVEYHEPILITLANLISMLTLIIFLTQLISGYLSRLKLLAPKKAFFLLF